MTKLLRYDVELCGAQSLTVPSEEQERTCGRVLCADRPQTALACDGILECNTLASTHQKTCHNIHQLNYSDTTKIKHIVWLQVGSLHQSWREAQTLITVCHWHSHRWARAHCTLARVGHEICTNSKSFFCRSRGGGRRLCMSLKVHRIRLIFYEHITKMRLSTADCICISALWGLGPQTLAGALTLDSAGDFRAPDLLCQLYLQTLAMLMQYA